MRKRIHKFVSLVLTGVMVLACPVLPNNSKYVQAADIPIRENVETSADPSNGMILIGVEGLDNTSDMQTLLDRVNAIRKEACSGGVPDPREPYVTEDGVTKVNYLKPSDYVEMKIGVNCNTAAQIRAAEAAVRAYHTRPNGTNSQSCLNVLYKLNPSCGGRGENLAWNTVAGSDIEGWIAEKNDWIYYKRTTNLPTVNGEQVQTGHYATLINPDYKFTGMSTFNPVNDNAWGYVNGWYCTAGSYAESDTELIPLPNAQNSLCIQKMQVPVKNVEDMEISGNAILNVGDTAEYQLLVNVFFCAAQDGTVGDNATSDCPVYDGVTWSSSDDNIVSIDENGRATVNAPGTVQIKASIGKGTSTKTLERKIIVLAEGVTIIGAVDPQTVVTESGVKPILNKKAELCLSDGDSVSVDVDWDDYDKKELDTVRFSNEFNVTGNVMGYSVTQKVHVKPASIVRCYGKKNSTEIDTIETDSGQCPGNLDSEVIVFRSGSMEMHYPLNTDWNTRTGTLFQGETDIFYVSWDKTSLEKYKERGGGDFEITGTANFNYDGKNINYPITQKMHVNPATVTDVLMPAASTVIETESGTEPVYPKATVTWSNGDIDDDDIVWADASPSTTYSDINDTSRKYMMKDGGTYELTGVYSGRTTTITVKVSPATATKATLTKLNYETKCGTAPELPSTANVTWSNKDETNESIVWETLDPEKYNKLEGNDYTVSGTCAGCSVTANISVLPATINSVDKMSITTSERVDPTNSLPKTATVNWSNDTNSEVPVVWDEISASDYAAPGTFEINGHITDMYGKKVSVTCDVEVKKRELVSIALENGELENNTSIYNYKLSDIKGAIIATYDNGETSKINIVSDMISEFNATSTSSNQEITITYTEGEITKTVNTTLHLVKREGIQITVLPTKLEYVEGEVDELDIKGIQIKELLDNGDENIISDSEYSVNDFSGFNPNPASYGDQTITLSLYGWEDHFTVKVKKKTLTGISISGPTNKTYVQGQEFSVDGLEIYGTYDNKRPAEKLPLEKAIVRINPILVDDPLRASLGDEVTTDNVGELLVYVFYPCEIQEGDNGEVTSTYLWKTFEINVIEKEIESVEIKTQPSRKAFPQNDISYSEYKFSDGVLLVNYNDGNSIEVGFDDTTISGFDISTLGTQEVTVSYGGKTVSFNAKVNEPTLSKTYVTPPTATGYAEDEYLNLSGTKINLLYDNGVKTEIALDEAIASGDAEISFDDGSNITDPLTENKKLIITYKGKVLKDINDKDIIISVSQRVGIIVSCNPTRTSYVEGQVLNLSGMKIESVFADGKTSEIPSSDYSVNNVVGFDSSVIGDQELTITVYNLSTTFNVSVRKKKMVSLEVTTLPTQTTYAAGQPLDISGMSVKAFYDNNTAEVLACSNDGETPITLANIRMSVGTTGNGVAWSTTTVGDAVTYYVTYKENYEGAPYIKEPFSLKIEPKVVQSLKVETAPTDNEYIQNSTSFNANTAFGSGILKVTNNCGFVEYVGFRDEGVTISGFDISSVGEQTVTVSYGGRSTTFKATVVEPTLTSKTVTPPTKTSYNEGEAISLAGAAVVKTYDNGLSETINLSQDAATLEAEGIKVVFVDAAGKEYAVNDSSVTTTTGAKTLVVKYKTSADGEPEQWEELKMPGGTAVSVNIQKKQDQNPSGGGGNGTGTGTGNGTGKGTGGTGNGNGGTGSGGTGNGSGGAKKNTLVTTSKGTQYVKVDGSYAKNEWVTINGTKYYFNADSYNASNEWRDGKWISADGSCTYSGQLLWKNNSTGWWVEDTVGWYPQNSWQKIDGVWYYFNSSGYMASGEWYDGYWFNSDGSWDPTYKLTWKGNSSGWWIEDISGWWPSSCWQKIDGSWYYFDGSGYMVTNQYVDGYWIGSDGVCN